MKDDYQPWDIWDDIEAERLREVERAAHKDRSKGNEGHEEEVRKEEGEERVLREHQQGKARIEKVARIKRKRGRPPKSR